MAALILPSRRVVQPQQPAEVDPRFGLRPFGLFLGSTAALDIAARTPMVRGNAVAFRAGAAGMGALQNASNTGLYRAAPNFQSTTEYTAIWHGVPIGAPVGGTPAFVGLISSTVSQSEACIAIEYSSATQLKVVFQSNTISGTRTGDFTWSDVYGAPTTLIASYSVSEGLARLDVSARGMTFRVIEASVSSAAPPALTGTEQFVVGPDVIEQPSRYINANVAMAGVFYGRLREGDLRAVLTNPWQLFAPPQRRIWVAGGGGGASPQTLAPGLLVNSQSFFAPTVGRGSVSVTPGLLTNSQAFYSPTVSAGGTSIAPPLLTNSQTFYASTITRGAVVLAPSLVSNQTTFYPAVVSAGGSVIQPPLLTNGQTFYAPALSVGDVTVSPSLLTNANQFFEPVVSGGAVLQPPLLVNSQSFYAPAVTAGEVELLPPLLANEAIFFGPAVGSGAVVNPPLVSNTSGFFAPTVTRGAVTLAPGLIVNQQVFYGPAIVADQFLQAALLQNASTIFPPSVIDHSVSIEIEEAFIARPTPRNWVAKNSPRNWEART